MSYFQKLQSGKWIFSILILSIVIASCKKETDDPTTTSNEKLSGANDVGLPPGFIGWGRGPDIPIVDQHGNPVSGVVYAFAFAIGGKGYIGGGLSNPVGPGTTWQYDTITRAWSQVANFPGGNYMIAATFVIGTNAYVCTGGPNGTKENWQYNQLTNLWTRAADFPGASRFGAVGTAINGKGYVGLGVNCDNPALPDTKDWWEYDAATNAWTRKADFPGTKRDYAVSFTINNKGYVSTGHHHNVNTGTEEYFKDLWQYNPANDSWTQKADLPGAARESAIGAGAFMNKGVVATGDTGSPMMNDCWEYNPSNNSWAQLPYVGGGPRSGAVAFSLGNTLYIGTAHGNDFWGLTINP